ncbi:hypothetical protein V202x_24770 [Gimesia aquarii]|uniref:Uncharacterized protein n=1 Tax=Gimesia aquarii TaxID=2527964 RepID=A0A517WV15_9PLAN|nr:hypothetical protein V202x_24770 [Gimesia aquarii]
MELLSGGTKKGLLALPSTIDFEHEFTFELHFKSSFL